MPSVKAKLNYLRISPRKTRLVADLIRRKKVEEARSILAFTIKRGAAPFSKLLDSVIANAKNNFQMDPSNLYISEVTVDEGPKLKRWMSRARGSAYPIQKKTSHITICLEEIIPGKKVSKPKKKTAEEPAKEKEIAGKETKKTRPAYAKDSGEAKQIVKPKVNKGLNKIFRRKSV